MTFRFWFGKEMYVLRPGDTAEEAEKKLTRRQRKQWTKVEQVLPSSMYRDGGKW